MKWKIGVLAVAAVAAFGVGNVTAAETDWDAAMCAMVDPQSNAATWFIGQRQGQAVYRDRGDRIEWTSKTAPVPVFVKRMVTRQEGTSVRLKCVSA